MRNKAIYFLLLVISLSCSHDQDPNDTQCNEPDAYLKYRFDGTLIEINGSLIETSKEGVVIQKVQKMDSYSVNNVLTNSNYTYSLTATKNYFLGPESHGLIYIEFDSPIAATTYPVAKIVHVNVYYPKRGVFCNAPNCNVFGNTTFTLTISRIVNGYADGSFSGTIWTEPPNPIYYQITEGEFRNVKILE